MKKIDIETRLEAHYRQVRLREAPDAEAKASAIARIAAEAQLPQVAEGAAGPVEAQGGRGRGFEGGRPGDFVRFVLGQVRYIRPWVWAGQATLLLALVVGSWYVSAGPTVSALVSTVALATVLVGMPDVLRSREDGVIELEYACRFDCRQVLAARLIVLGLSDVVMLTVAVLAVPPLAGTDPVLVFLHACVPYFVTTAGCLWIASRPRKGATMRCFAFGAGVAVVAATAWQVMPGMYEASAVGVWAALFALSLAAAVYEMRVCLDVVRSGFDHLIPAA